MEYKLRFNDDRARDAGPQFDEKLPQEELDTEFKKEFPPDPVIGSELDDAARVWKVYRKEANAYDSALLDGWSSTLDILLIFAGLFSAVATAFVIDSDHGLSDPPDHSARYTAAALYILVSATNHSTGIHLRPPPELDYYTGPPRPEWASPSYLGLRMVSILWFTSIMLSLSVAFLSILVKQWIGEYRARNLASAKSPRHWAHRHQVYSQALHAWPVGALVSLLPVILHISLFLFFAGTLISQFDPINGAILALGCLLIVFYLGCTLIPLWVPQCPTSTPLTHQVRRLVLSVAILALRACFAALPLVFKLRYIIVHRFLNRRSEPRWMLRPTLHSAGSSADRTVRERLKQAIERLAARRRDRSGIAELMERRKDKLSISALRWLIFDVSDSDAVAVGIQSLGALHPTSVVAGGLRHLPFDRHNCFTRSAAGPSVSEAIRAGRSNNCLKTYLGSDTIHDVLRTSRYPDALALYGLGRDEHFVNHTSFPTLTSTIIRVMWAFRLERSEFLALLALCNFKQFASADWNVALDSIPTTTSDDLTGSSSIRCSPELRPHSIAQWVADTFETLDSVRDKRSATRAIYHLLPEYRISGSVWRSRSPSGQWPPSIPLSVLKVLATPTNDLKLDAQDLDTALHCLNGAVIHNQREETYWTALACILDSTRFLDLPDTNVIPWLTCMHGIEAWEHRESPETAYAILRAVLLPNPASGARSSIWTMLRQMGFAVNGLRLAASLADVLRTHIQGPSAASDNTPFTDLFFAELDPHDVVAALTADRLLWDHGKPIFDDRLPSDPGMPVELVQRCSELRPEWWIAVRDYASQSTSEHERDMVLAIEQKLGSLIAVDVR